MINFYNIIWVEEYRLVNISNDNAREGADGGGQTAPKLTFFLQMANSGVGVTQSKTKSRNMIPKWLWSRTTHMLTSG